MDTNKTAVDNYRTLLNLLLELSSGNDTEKLALSMDLSFKFLRNLLIRVLSNPALDQTSRNKLTALIQKNNKGLMNEKLFSDTLEAIRVVVGRDNLESAVLKEVSHFSKEMIKAIYTGLPPENKKAFEKWLRESYLA